MMYYHSSADPGQPNIPLPPATALQWFEGCKSCCLWAGQPRSSGLAWLFCISNSSCSPLASSHAWGVCSMVPKAEPCLKALSVGEDTSQVPQALPHPHFRIFLSGIVTYLLFIILCRSRVLLTSEEKWKRRRKIVIEKQFKGQLHAKMVWWENNKLQTC